MDTTPKKTNGRRNRSAGHSYEKDLARMLREKGFEYVHTSRHVSPVRDAQKVDLANIDEFTNGRLPYNIQAKCCTGTIQYAKILHTLPVEKDIINVVLHKQTRKVGSKFLPSGYYAFMKQEDFMSLIARLNHLEKHAQ